MLDIIIGLIESLVGVLIAIRLEPKFIRRVLKLANLPPLEFFD